jgi:DNA invertase Pin-like site-specific DNA recombinase
MVVFHHFQGGVVPPLHAALYARVSTHDQQTLAMQMDAMHECATRRGWTVIDAVEEIASGAKDRRPKRQALLTAARQRKFDVILVWKLDRWGRSLVDSMTTLHELTVLGVRFVSLTEALDLATPAGRAFAGFLAVLAEFERALIRERIKAGITDARKRGQARGRPRAKANDAAQIRTLAQQGLSQAASARHLGLWRTSVRRVLAQQEGT